MAILPLNKRVIYALVDPRDGVVRYVGVTNNPQNRFQDHIGRKTRRGPRKKALWLESLAKENLKPIFVFLDAVPHEVAETKEIWWIQHFSTISELYNYKKK
jgi:hypothetical protein